MTLVADLPTPFAVLDLATLNHNIDSMSTVRPGRALRSHVKAHKCSSLAGYLAGRSGSDTFCAATLREVEVMVRAGLGEDILLANETLNGDALGGVVALGAKTDCRLTVAVDSPETVAVLAAARRRGPVDALIDVNVGLPRCGVVPAYGHLVRAIGSAISPGDERHRHGHIS